jgi:hypothetical protein
MNKTISGSLRLAVAAAAAIGALTAPGLVLAQEHHEGPHHFEPYRTPHMVFDNRYQHGHYYPAIGYSVNVLPPGYLTVGFGPRHLYFHGGVWWEPRGPGFVVIRPPFGVVIPVLPPAYSTVWYGGVPYYYADDVYYTQGSGGYVVTAPPPGDAYSDASAPQAPMPMSGPGPGPGPAPQQYMPPPPASSAPAPAPNTWYWCESTKGYYPYVQECREGWRSVPASPPPQQ